MAILSCEKLSLEIRFREIDEHQNVQYDAWLRFDGKPLINPAVLKREEGYWQDRIADSLRAADGLDDSLIPTLQEALETNQPRSWRPADPGFELFIYPEVYFPPITREDFETPFRLNFTARHEQAELRRAESEGKLPDDLINVYLQVDLMNFSGQESYGGTGAALQMCVYRWEVENFLDDLKYEYAELLRRYPQRMDDARAFRDWQIPFDAQPRPVEVYFFQGDMNGWIHINLTVDGIQQTVWASNVFPPFDELLDLITAVAEGSLPAQCMINEEGRYKVFRARPWDAPGQFRFELVQPDYPHFHTFMDYVFDRRQFALAFYNDLVSFLQTHFQAEKWGTEELVPVERMQRLRAALQGFPLEGGGSANL